jgi:hypothetical protein
MHAEPLAPATAPAIQVLGPLTAASAARKKRPSM